MGKETAMSNLTNLDRKIRGITDEVSLVFYLKSFLESHSEHTGEDLQKHRSVDLCNPKFCIKNGQGCPRKVEFRKHLFCICV